MKSYIILLMTILTLLQSEVGAQSKSKKVKGTDYLITIHTEFGNIDLLLYNQTPLHRANFIKLTQEHYFDSTTFHRVISGFMIQGGDPNSKDNNPYNDGQGGPNYTIPAEFRPELKHKRGSLCAARLSDQVNPERASSGSQFYIVQYDNAASTLDGSYTVFGQVMSGMEVVNKITEQPVDARSRPAKDIRMTVTLTEMKKKDIISKYNCASFYQQ